MSVYTKITDGELESHLENYSLGKIRNFSGISEGIENSNYLLNTVTQSSSLHNHRPCITTEVIVMNLIC